MKKKVLYSAPELKPMVIQLEENLAFTYNSDGNEKLGNGEEEEDF